MVREEMKDTTKMMKREGNVSRSDRLETYLVELQKEKNLLLGQQQETGTNPPIYHIEPSVLFFLCVHLKFLYCLCGFNIVFL